MTSLLAISDVHIGCPRINPKLLHERLIKFLYPQITSDIKILFICGDFFDTALSLSAAAAFEALKIIDELKKLCRSVGCDLRILRGTFTHDRRQPAHFINGEDPDDTSVRMYENMAVEYHAKTGLTILYLPDNIPSKDIYKDIRELLDSHNLDKVDILINHGYFEHMLPPNIPAPHGCLTQEKISKFVKGCVLNGHVHLTSIYKNVISVGSFERMVHGEESPKGFYRIDIDNDAYRFQFIENKEANKFITYNLRPFDQNEEAIGVFSRAFEELVSTLRPDEEVHIRFISDEQGIVDTCTQIAKSLLPGVTVDKAQVVKREQILENIPMELSELPVITPLNLEELLMPILNQKDPNISSQTVHNILERCAVKEN